jgi:hypothetical protein
MSLYREPSQPESDTEHLTTEARKVLTQLADTTFWAYCQLENYEKNNTQGVKPKEFQKALGKDHKDFVSIKGAMKRLLVKINPEFKTRIAELHPKTAKAAK